MPIGATSDGRLGGPTGSIQDGLNQNTLTIVDMTDRQLKFGVAPVGVGGPGQQNTWLDPEIPGDASVKIDWYIERARQAEKALFDFVFVVDSQFITADSPPHYLNRLEPLTLLAALAVSTDKIGLVATITTSYTEPFHVARQLASVDLISHGRAGWNVVTSLDPGTSKNYGREEHFDYADPLRPRASSTSRSPRASGTPTRTTPSPATRPPASSSTRAASTRSTTRASTSRWSAR